MFKVDLAVVELPDLDSLNRHVEDYLIGLLCTHRNVDFEPPSWVEVKIDGRTATMEIDYLSTIGGHVSHVLLYEYQTQANILIVYPVDEKLDGPTPVQAVCINEGNDREYRSVEMAAALLQRL